MLALTICIVVNSWRRPVRRMIVVRSGGHIWGRSAWRRAVELALARGRLLRRGIVVLVVHMVLLTGVRHCARGTQEGDASVKSRKGCKDRIAERTMNLWLFRLPWLTAR